MRRAKRPCARVPDYSGERCVVNGLAAGNMRFCKTTPCIKKSPNDFNDMTLHGFGTSETRERRSARQFEG
jgi:hypothetical protein